MTRLVSDPGYVTLGKALAVACLLLFSWQLLEVNPGYGQGRHHLATLA